MEPLQLNLYINIDIYYTIVFKDSTPITASKRKLRIPYSEFSEIREYFRSILDDRSKYKMLGANPSFKSKSDRARWFNILPKDASTDPYDQTYRARLDQYLKIEPESNSFYVTADVLENSEAGSSVCRLTMYPRISNHLEQNRYVDPETRQKIVKALKKKYGKDESFDIVPVDFIVNFDVKQPYQSDQKNYLLTVVQDSNVLGQSFHCHSIEEVKTKIAETLEEIRLQCIEDHKTIKTSTDIYTDNDFKEFMEDVESALEQWNIDLQSVGDDTLVDYTWTCEYVEHEGSLITYAYITDNHGSKHLVECWTDIDEYMESDPYREDELKEICIQVFDAYSWMDL